MAVATTGVDIGYETVKIVGLRRTRSAWRLDGLAIGNVPVNPWKIDELTHRDEIAKVIRETMRHAKPHPITGKQTTIALPESVIFSTTFATAALTPREMKESLPLEIAEKLSINLEDFHLDYEQISTICRPVSSLPTAASSTPKNGGKAAPAATKSAAVTPQLTVFAVAAKKTLIQSTIELCHQAGLELTGIDVKPGAIARAAAPDDNKIRLIVDMGMGGTSASIAEGKSLRVTATIPWGIHAITDKITGPVENLREKAAPVFDELVHISKFFENRICPGNQIEQLIITGSGANIPNILEVFAKETGLPASLSEPFKRVDCRRFPVPAAMTHTFTDAIGLAMRG